MILLIRCDHKIGVDQDFILVAAILGGETHHYIWEKGSILLI